MHPWLVLICVGSQVAVCFATVGLYIENCLSKVHGPIPEAWVASGGPLALDGLLNCGDVIGAVRAAERSLLADNTVAFLASAAMSNVLLSMARKWEIRSIGVPLGHALSLERIRRMSAQHAGHSSDIIWETFLHSLNDSAMQAFVGGNAGLLIYTYGRDAARHAQCTEISSLGPVPQPLTRVRRSSSNHIRVPRDVAGDKLSLSLYRIGVVEYPPFMMYDLDADGTVRNPNGIIMEIIRALANRLNFSYTLVSQVRHGIQDKDGQWSGGIGALLNDEVDMLAMDLSITPVRVQLMDFTLPFMQGSQGIVVRRSIDAPTLKDLVFNHLRPFHWSIWLVMGACWLVASGLLITAKDHPTETSVVFFRDNKKNVWRKDRESECRDPWWSVVFQILGLFCQQGCSLSPSRPSAKVIFFSVCLTALVCYNFYTSVFISFTTVAKTSTSMDTLADVLRDRSFQVGFVRSIGERIEEMFKNSEVPSYKLAWKRMQLTDRTYVDDVEEGMARTFTEKFAFIAETHTLEWFTGKNCSFKLLHERVLHEGYSFALPNNSSDTRVFSKYIKLIVENGLVTRLRSSVMPSLTPDFCDDSGALEAVGLDRTAGLFLCLTIGCAVACVSLWLERVSRGQSAMLAKTVIISVKANGGEGRF